MNRNRRNALKGAFFTALAISALSFTSFPSAGQASSFSISFSPAVQATDSHGVHPLGHYLQLGYEIDTSSLSSKMYENHDAMATFFISKAVTVTNPDNGTTYSFKDVKLCSLNGNDSITPFSGSVMDGRGGLATCISLDPRTPNP